jgi:hypothetical protein
MIVVLENQHRHGGGRSYKFSPQVALSALDTNDLELAQECGNAVAKKFPGSQRVSKMAGMLLEAQGEWEEADRVSRLLFLFSSCAFPVHLLWTSGPHMILFVWVEWD